MPSLPHLSGREIVRALERLGFVQARQRGSHVVMKKSTNEGTVGCVVPMHNEVAIGTLHSILKQARISAEDFLKVVK
ncbi:MAG: type II toxin-antitoxin system HicA family toxin [Anaerolineae bacterium]|nr:type II toxin-antitoxin system HicA family toxin [Anaerolineae bacterium]MBL8105361.1 type II toxin-antitoxin system HicA family toxin [Anaerolineales bacterium]MCC7189551.1 type II toxin-antitoxin system HicA family toxin [Anaerolineales bacterium]